MTTKKVIKKKNDLYLDPKCDGEYDGEKLYVINDDDLENFRITKTGKIYSMKSKSFKPTQIVNGYKRLPLGKSKKMYSIHRLVALTFLNQIDVNKNVVNHIDENKQNNNLDNLEWVTQKENTVKHNKTTSHSRQVKQIDVNTNQIVNTYDQITLAASAIGLSRRAIQMVLNGKNKTAGGYFWEYIDENNYHDIIVPDNDGQGMKVYDYDNYIVYKDGRIYNTNNKKFLSPCINNAGRAYITLCKTIDGKYEKKNRYIHTIVADHYLPNKPNPQSEVHHINGDAKDNQLSNLKWSNKTQGRAIIMQKNEPKVVEKSKTIIVKKKSYQKNQ